MTLPADRPADQLADGAAGEADELVEELVAAGLSRGGPLALCLQPGRGAGLACGEQRFAVEHPDPVGLIAVVEQRLRPRWVCWSGDTAATLVAGGLRVATCWDLAAVHRLLFGGWQAGPALIWAQLHELATDALPGLGQLDLLGAGGDEGTDLENPVRPDGHLRPEWPAGGWQRTPDRMARWAATALQAATAQRARLAQLTVTGDAEATARSESGAELLCAELAHDGLPIDPERARQLIASFIGARPADAEQAALIRARRDAAVLREVPRAEGTDLRSPGQVRLLLARVGIDVPDTRSWRLERYRGAHPVIEALLGWRKAERVATTYGYDWLERNVGADGRLRGSWTGSDGAAGRMTASAGLHNLPADLRPAVAAGPGLVFVRADLGQIEPRVLAAVSGDRALARASQDEDLYAPIAGRLGVDRPTAKIAVLAAMYGQTSGAAGQALKGLEQAYPVAMGFLRKAHEDGRAGRSVRTYGGRLVRMWPTPSGLDPDAERANLAARGRYARNAVVQGAAAELFKAWAVTVRARGLPLQARIVLCLHDELLVQVAAERGDQVRRLLHDCLAEAAGRWAPAAGVRFVADISVIGRWSEAKS